MIGAGGRPDGRPDGRRRVVVENPTPAVDGGRFPVKGIVGDEFVVEADVFADGHDELDVRLRWLPEEAAPGAGAARWRETPMEPLGNDRWRASFRLESLGRYRYTVAGMIDRVGTWQRDLRARAEAGQDLAVDLEIGAALLDEVSRRAAPVGHGREEPAAAADAERLARLAADLRATAATHGGVRDTRPAFDPDLAALSRRHPDRDNAGTWEPDLAVIADRERARFSAWYELFPRSASPDPARHGTLRDVIARLPYVAGMGFDVLYLPPIQPIGTAHRKGPNNTVRAGPGDPGVPWAIGAPEGGHTAIHPALGTVADFEALVERDARRRHGDRTRHRVPGLARSSVGEGASRMVPPPAGRQRAVRREPAQEIPGHLSLRLRVAGMAGALGCPRGGLPLLDRSGVFIFRVDNPHTKPFAFWEWVIARLRRDHPDVLFLAEAFTRPRVMQRLAKVGFTQ